MEKLLSLDRIYKQFYDHCNDKHSVLRGVDLSVNQGQIAGVVGESGCGKSTLARIVCQLINSSDGRIIFDGCDISEMKVERRRELYLDVQMVFQNPAGAFSPRMKIINYLIEPFVNYKIMDKKAAKSFAAELLEMVGLERAFLSRYPNELSGGQLQRVVIARAIGLKPKLLVCDECTSALDVSVQKQIISLIKRLQREYGFACIFITHDLNLADSMCDIINVMYRGSIVETIPGGRLKESCRHPYSRVLLNSMFTTDSKPKITSNVREIIIPEDTDNGCLYAGKCRIACDAGKAIRPEMKIRNSGAAVACHNQDR